MSVSGIWTRSARLHGDEQRPSSEQQHEPGFALRPEVERGRSPLPWWLAGAAAGMVGAFLLDLAADGRERALVLLYCAVHTASVLLLTEWLRRCPNAPPADPPCGPALPATDTVPPEGASSEVDERIRRTRDELGEVARETPERAGLTCTAATPAERVDVAQLRPEPPATEREEDPHLDGAELGAAEAEPLEQIEPVLV